MKKKKMGTTKYDSYDLIDVPIPKTKPAPPKSNIVSNSPTNSVIIGTPPSPSHYNSNYVHPNQNWINTSNSPNQFSDLYGSTMLSLKEMQDAKILLREKISTIDELLADETVDVNQKKEATLTKLILKYILSDISRMIS